MTTAPEQETAGLREEIRKHRRILLGELKERILWFIQLRWWVPPSIVAGVLVARLLGVEFAAGATLGVAAFILVYNAVLFVLSRELQDRSEERQILERFSYWQVTLDYAAMFLLIHFTGGAASPFIFFFIFHIIFASILLPPRAAYGFAGLAAAGMAVIAASEYLGWIPRHELFFRGQSIDLARQPFHMMVELAFFSASVFTTAFFTTSIITMLRKRMLDLAELSETIARLNVRFNSLYAMTQAMGSVRNLERVLQVVTRELASVMEVRSIAVKLLSEDGKYLRYAAVHGLLSEQFKDKLVETAKSPLNRRIIEGEPFTTGRLSHKEMFQFGEDLLAVNIQSVLFVPLSANERVIGILGAYSTVADRFTDKDVEFFRLAAGLVAIALDNARSYEGIEHMIRDRSWFMMRVAHNLRAPLAAVLSMIEVLREGHFESLNPDQAEYLRRIERRSRTMLNIINELMTLAENRDEKRKLNLAALDPAFLAGRLQRTFQDEAAEKNLNFQIVVADHLPQLQGDLDQIEQLLENLVSNAVKYTPAGGKVKVSFSKSGPQGVGIEVADNGIGIPKDDLPRLFTEFFRANNAKQMEDGGTGLGMAIAKEIVDMHHGRIRVESEEGLGTIFHVTLPAWTRKEEKEG